MRIKSRPSIAVLLGHGPLGGFLAFKMTQKIVFVRYDVVVNALAFSLSYTLENVGVNRRLRSNSVEIRSRLTAVMLSKSRWTL